MTPSHRERVRMAGIGAAAGLLVLGGWASAGPPREAARPATAVPDTVMSFADDVLPIFRERCAQCHGGEDEAGQVITEAYLDLLTYEGVMMGSEFGTVVEPGEPAESVLLDMVEVGDMPEEGDPLPPEEIEIIRAWIAQGAADN